MAKIVSTKFGDRRLVNLPPVNFQGTKTPNVETIAPPGYTAQVDDNPPVLANRVHRPVGNEIVPKDYSYRGQQPRPAPIPAYPQTRRYSGNIVTETSPATIGDQIFKNLLQEANAKSLQGYGQGQYPVIPPVSAAQPYQYYTNQGLNAMQQQPPVQQAPQQVPYFNNQMPAPAPQPTVPVAPFPGYNQPFPGSNPNEKHIYYGPNGEVLPGPPPGFNTTGSVNIQQYPEDFAIEGMLHHGKLTTVNLVEASRGFPKIPDYLIKDLFDKYKQYERTIVRIVVRSGQTYVHATPDMVDGASPPQGNLEAEYVPVYLEEGEEFNYDKFMRQYQTGNYRAIGPGGGGNSPRRYGTPKQVPRSYPYNDYGDDRAYTTDIRPNTIDPMSHLRWQREGDRRSTAFTRYPVEQPQTRNYRSQMRN
ncbi:uncharacterized protein LOC128211893 [Mya arenaria]|uniref:uncharacterized protein LOC128211893 n=1 Tax=Mya arenaria TaxID=6604 RepID=UPI0022E8EA0C|nr:uncharacterized protein LOC128211893 [Mya arenaria]